MPSAPRPKVLLFDIDHTLIVTGGAGRRALEGAVRELTGRDADLLAVPFAGRTDPTILADLLASVGVASPAPALTKAILERYVTLLEEEMARGPGTLCPGVLPLLDALEGKPHVHLGLLTGNIERGARAKLRPFGIHARFAFGAYGDEAATRPGLLPVALERWRTVPPPPRQVRPEDVYVIGDTEHDVAVARAHGARAIAVGTGGRQTDRERLLASRPDMFLETLERSERFVEEVLHG